MKIIKYIFMIPLIFIMTYCSDVNDPVESDTYVPGEIIVIFQDTVNCFFMSNFIREINLELLEIYADSSFSIWVQVDSGKTIDYIHVFENDTSIAWADQRSYPFEDIDINKEYILIHFRGVVTIDYAIDIISSLNGIVYKKTLLSPLFTLLGVPIGSEQYWIDKLLLYPFIKYAGRNSVFHVI